MGPVPDRGARKNPAPRHAGQAFDSCGVELRGIEPLTFSLRTKRSTN